MLTPEEIAELASASLPLSDDEADLEGAVWQPRPQTPPEMTLPPTVATTTPPTPSVSTGAPCVPEIRPPFVPSRAMLTRFFLCRRFDRSNGKESCSVG